MNIYIYEINTGICAHLDLLVHGPVHTFWGPCSAPALQLLVYGPVHTCIILQ
jgi:hypothetical protein